MRATSSQSRVFSGGGGGIGYRGGGCNCYCYCSDRQPPENRSMLLGELATGSGEATRRYHNNLKSHTIGESTYCCCYCRFRSSNSSFHTFLSWRTSELTSSSLHHSYNNNSNNDNNCNKIAQRDSQNLHKTNQQRRSSIIISNPLIGHLFYLVLALMVADHFCTQQVAAHPDANRLYEDLMMTYHRFARPVQNDSNTLTVKLGLRLSQLIDVVSKHSLS